MLDFPSSPIIGQKYPQPPVAGQPVYVWDSEKWTTVGGAIGGKTPIFTDGSQAMTAQLTLVNPPVAATDAAAKVYVDGLAANAVKYTAQTLTSAQQGQGRINIYAAPFDALAYNGLQINGGCEVNQESPGAISSGGVYVIDGLIFQKNAATAVVSIAQFDASGVFPGIASKCLTMTCSTGQPSLPSGEFVFLQQMIEGYRIARLGWGTANAQPLSIGFWTAHARTGIYSGSIRNAALTRSCAFSYTQNVANAAEYKTVTIPGCTDGAWANNNTVGINLSFTIACGTSLIAPSANAWAAGSYIAAPGQVNGVAATTDFFRITGVIVVPGIELPSAARAPFILRPYDQEIVLCNRYLQYISPIAAIGNAASAGYYDGNQLVFPVPMRAAPTVTLFNFTYNTNCSAAQADGPTPYGCRFLVRTSAAGALDYNFGIAKLDARL